MGSWNSAGASIPGGPDLPRGLPDQVHPPVRSFRTVAAVDRPRASPMNRTRVNRLGENLDFPDPQRGNYARRPTHAIRALTTSTGSTPVSF